MSAAPGCSEGVRSPGGTASEAKGARACPGACTVEPVDSVAAALAVHPLIVQLRPHLADADEFLERWGRQCKAGYQLVVLRDAGTPVALAGYRLQENLVHGTFLYVDDLVTDARCRSSGYGEQLIRYLQEQAHEAGCSKLVLDTPMSNALGHRFYFRCGLLATALRFSTEVPHRVR
jgi:ribosomal protein S18 acetylase RimI-like enzyme